MIGLSLSFFIIFSTLKKAMDIISCIQPLQQTEYEISSLCAVDFALKPMSFVISKKIFSHLYHKVHLIISNPISGLIESVKVPDGHSFPQYNIFHKVFTSS